MTNPVTRDIREAADHIARYLDDIEITALRLSAGMINQAEAAQAFEMGIDLAEQYFGVIRASTGSLTHPPRQHPSHRQDNEVPA